jgi:hypothetical protein
MDDEAFKALQRRVIRYVIEADEATARAATATEELLAEIDRRAAGETATVTPLFTRGETQEPGDDGA